tara:strand:- start:70 stop:1515 length:1446 start_codon:yes stop_codon:yes gene_type:complete
MVELVSIAISTYEANGKGPEFLTRNLNQIMKQTYENIEIVISDHASDDTIKDVCKKFSSHKYPIKYVHNPHHKGNISQNINNAIDHCQGVYIKILFMDDYLFHEDVIQQIVHEFQQHSEKKWLVHSYIHTKNHKDFYYLHHPRFSHDIIFCNKIGCPSCLTIHKSVSERFDVNIKWYMDCELYFRINAIYDAPIFLHNSKPYMVNVHHENQVTNKDIDNTLIEKETLFIRNKYTPTSGQANHTMKICFVTSLFGDNYEASDKPTRFDKVAGCDYLLFTNYSKELFNTSWEIINVSEHLKHVKSNIIKSRYPKFMGWKLIKDVMNTEYDIIVYCDCYLCPKTNVDWTDIAQKMLNQDSSILQQPHSRCAYEELIEIYKQKKDTKERCEVTKIYMSDHDFPNKVTMPENCVFMYDPNNKKLQQTFEDFWDIYSPYSLSHRDQPLWSYVLWKNKVKPLLTSRSFMRNNLVQHRGVIGFNGHQYT